ncbi:hypothetical protein BD289DRAFT_178876 [Coniella lustricola]|uniref:Uncharacterized protein n=1 Tax=Coniella lustricola TaxID=2025994 RepID=A0A2T3ADL5_9PEZI|nr:hypothetical protein BD289DRAFT_178876 [Coniella lustricola]
MPAPRRPWHLLSCASELTRGGDQRWPPAPRDLPSSVAKRATKLEYTKSTIIDDIRRIYFVWTPKAAGGCCNLFVAARSFSYSNISINSGILCRWSQLSRAFPRGLQPAEYKVYHGLIPTNDRRIRWLPEPTFSRSTPSPKGFITHLSATPPSRRSEQHIDVCLNGPYSRAENMPTARLTR